MIRHARSSYVSKALATLGLAVLFAAIPATALAGKFPDLALVKEDHVTSVVPGQIFFYQLTYENNGAFAPNVVIFDTIPVGTTFDAPGSTPGWSCAHGAPPGTVCEIAIPDLPPNDPGDAVAIALRVDSALPAGFDRIENTGEIRWFVGPGTPGHEDNLDDNSSTHTTPVDVSGIAPDLVLGKDDGGVSVAPGGIVAYQLTYANAGTRGATGVEITDTVPAFSTFDAAASTAGWTCAHGAPAGTECRFALGTLQPGAGAAIVFAVRVDPVLPPGAQAIENLASIADDGANGADLDPTNNLATDSTPFGGPGAGPDLAVTKNDGGVSAAPGDLVSYQIGYANLGPRGATGVHLGETVPDHATFDAGASSPGWSCAHGAPPATPCTLAVGTLLAGGAGAATFAVRVDSDLPPGVTAIHNTIVITDDGTNGPDVDPSNNVAADTTPVIQAPGDVALEATAIDTPAAGVPARPGDDVAYTVVITNVGSTLAQRVELEASPPGHTTLRAGTVTTTAGGVAQGNDPGDTEVLVVVGELAAGAEAVITFEVTLDSPLPSEVEEIAFQGVVRAAGDLSLLTDDPDTPAPGDPTRTPVAQGAGPAPAEIPTVGTLGLLALAALLGLAARFRLRTTAA